jgi:hypothetical protein
MRDGAQMLFAVATVLAIFVMPGWAQSASKADLERVCLKDQVYREVSQTLLNARSSIAVDNYKEGVKLLDAGIERLDSYATTNRLSDYHDPSYVILDDTGLGLAAAYDFQRKGNWAAAAGLKSSTLEGRLQMVCEELAYKANHPGRR